jgi:hypothetical protein
MATILTRAAALLARSGPRSRAELDPQAGSRDGRTGRPA